MVKIIILIFLFANHVSAKDSKLKEYFNNKWKLTDRSIEYLKEGKVLTESEVNTDKGQQEFKLSAAALHSKKCTKVLRKLSMLENYSEWIDFIKSSSYDDKNGLFTVKADHALLPFPMIVHIFVKRPTTPGIYPFIFPTGIFTGLKGKFHITEQGDQCLFYAHSYWKGNKTKIPDFVIELFSETLSKLGAELLMRKTAF